ncbi:MAG: hypothetical protein ACE141_11390 [Bryobacteraceae bacterium]
MRILIASAPCEADYRCLAPLDTNQGISGWGDVRGRASKTYTLILKSRIMGMNPRKVSEIFYCKNGVLRLPSSHRHDM